MPPSPGQEDNTRQSRERWVTLAEAQGPLLPLGRLSFHNRPQRLVEQTMEGSAACREQGLVTQAWTSLFGEAETERTTGPG